MIAVFFDMDGVLVDFVAGVLKQHGREDIPYDSIQWGLEVQLGIEPAKFWEPLGYDFWANLPSYKDGLELLIEVEKLIDPAQIGLLTSPCDTPGCIDSKRAWIKRHLPDYSKRLFVGSAKHLFAGPEKLLVDDNGDNCKKFREAGGRVHLVPRPWNIWKTNKWNPAKDAEDIECALSDMLES